MRAFVTDDRVDPNQWWMMMVQGIASLIVGSLLLVSPSKTVALAVQFLGLYWLITGVFSLVGMFVSHPDRPRWLNLVSGILGIVAGLAVLNHPLWSAVLIPSVLVIFLGVEGILIGLLGIAQAIEGGRGWRGAILGLLSIVLGALLLASPLFSATVFVSISAVVAVVGGLVAIGGAVMLRSL